jgi:hypothetical protein
MRFLNWIGENSPCISDELESMIGEMKSAFVRMKKESETAVLFLDEVEVVGSTIDLENGVPIRVVVDAFFRGVENFDDC